MTEITCIVCPRGCRLLVDETRGYSVTGNTCPRGEEYGKMELVHPTRVVTSTVRCPNGAHPRCPVKTDQPVPKDIIFQVMAELDQVTLQAPVRTGQIVVGHVCGTEANVVATRDLAPAPQP